ncbi:MULTISPECIES: glycosyltransferase family 4 protein [Pseudomonas]|uniref:glycosyltransferase family 4 protein n=1 Tax=Pseudomonas TaxID=286 RepID=UPI0008B24D7C|nr:MULTISPECIES: glycosyltransferase family 4 protein [Pseudomonas]WDG52060.1 glycosyltransferase family 4 protein [Pseudomonas chlororaphis]WDH86923.1 glycosyltransferase family 4 protein [Pseudomonas chlororaphis]SEL45897.1 rhamnosyl/mannosyltransferase [Pseudomonas sp. NFACC41-3]SMH49813.1 rhamnosyl/mannosyltransferase [Pseudomonas sp. NFIX51]
MIKVLHFFKTYYPETMGGIEQVIFQIAEGCVSHGFESEVLYLSDCGAARNEVVGHHLTHRSKLDLHVASTGFSLSAFKDFAELARQADIVHYHFPWPYMDLVHFASRLRKPTVVSYHSDIVKQKFLLKLYQPLMNRFLSSVDSIVASSPNYAQSSPVLTRFEDKVRIIPYGLDRETYPTPSPAKLEYWRGLLGSRFFLFVGALRYYKGLDYLLEAAKRTQLPVVILGGGHLEAELKAQAAQLGLSNVHFLGGLPDEDKAALLQLCYAFVFPSHLRSESFGISLLEGAMYGKPMISCEIGSGTTFINIADETGLVVPPCDAVALAHAMMTLWQSPEQANQMGQRAMYRYEQIFSSRSMASAYADLYRELLKRPEG